MINLSQLPPGTPVWIVVAVVLTGAVLTFSEKVATLAGPLGALARWWQRRNEDSLKKADSLRAKINEAVREETRWIREELDAVRNDMAAMRAAHTTELAEAHAERDRERSESEFWSGYATYLLHELRWIVASAATHGWAPPIPSILTPAQWRAGHRPTPKPIPKEPP